MFQPPADAEFTEVLRQLVEVAADVGADELAAEGQSLAERLAEGRSFVACAGQFKRGKSTLLNALIGDPLLPTGVVPVTAVLTVVRHGPRRAARVRRAGSAWEEIDPAALAAYVTEGQNPENRKRVEGVEVFVPSPLLASGMCFVDTPGIGSVFSASTKIARDFVPHVDAALVVLGADPPLSGEELALVEEVARQTERLIFVLSKADRLSDADRQEARQFAEALLTRRLSRPVEFLEVSAAERLSGQITRDWKALEAELEALARDSGVELLRAAATRGVSRVAGRLLRAIDEHREALLRPLDDRIAELRRSIADAERTLADIRPLLAAAQADLVSAFDAERGACVARALPAALGELDRALMGGDARAKRGVRDRAMELARGIARRVIEEWLRDVEPRAEELYRRATGRFIEGANAFLARLRTSGDPTLARLSGELVGETTFRAKRRFYFHDLLTVASPRPGGRLATLLRPRRRAIVAAREDARRYLERLLVTNSARVSNDLVDRAAEDRRRLESEIVSLLRGLSTSAERALRRARDRHVAGAEAVRAELSRLESLRERVLALHPGVERPA